MPKTLKNILIGTPLSEGSDEVVQTGVSIARASGATPHLAHIMTLPPTYVGLPGEYYGATDEAVFEAYRQELNDKLAAQARRTGLLGEDGRAGVLHFETGVPHRGLEGLASTLQADLIVVGATERRHRHLGLGSTADRVIRRAPCPVLLVRPGIPFPPKRVLAPVDFSTGSAGALRFGVGLLESIVGKVPGIEVLFVMSPGESTLHFSPEQIARFATAELHRFVDKAVPQAARTVDCRVRSGYPAEQIVQEIEEKHPELAFLGTREKSGIERLMIGSVASSLLREAPCNVLVIPPEIAHLEAQEIEAQAARAADWSYVSDEEPELAGMKS